MPVYHIIIIIIIIGIVFVWCFGRDCGGYHGNLYKDGEDRDVLKQVFMSYV